MKEIYRGTVSSQGTRTRVMLNDEDDHEDDGVSRCYYRVETALGDSKDGYFEDSVTIDFQAGSVEEEGINGIQDEGLLAVLIHRYDQFQSGPSASDEVVEALWHLKAAQRAMKRRTQELIDESNVSMD